MTVARGDWAFADCRTTPFPGTPDPTRLCLKDGFDPEKLYELVYTAKDPLVLGIGLAATRDIVVVLPPRRDGRGRHGKPGRRRASRMRSRSATRSPATSSRRSFTSASTRICRGGSVWDGVFPRIAATADADELPFRAAGRRGDALRAWQRAGRLVGHATRTRRAGASRASLLDRCTRHARPARRSSRHSASTEFWGLRMSPGLIGTDAKADIPLPDNVRRYYYPGTTHGGGRGGFRVDAAGRRGGGCSLPANPNPGSRHDPRADRGTRSTGSSRARSRRRAGIHGSTTASWSPRRRRRSAFPDLPGLTLQGLACQSRPRLRLRSRCSSRTIMSGVISRQPPRIRQVIPTFVPKVNADGNETAGVPSVLHQAPLGTYLGWNLTASGFFAGQGCGFAGGYVPFAKTTSGAGVARRSAPLGRGALRHAGRLRLRRRARRQRRPSASDSCCRTTPIG